MNLFFLVVLLTVVSVVLGQAPTRAPTRKPTARPTRKPTARPTARPTRKPTARPTRKPTARPSAQAATPKPSIKPTARPTRVPTTLPTVAPTLGASEGTYVNVQTFSSSDCSGSPQFGITSSTMTGQCQIVSGAMQQVTCDASTGDITTNIFPATDKTCSTTPASSTFSAGCFSSGVDSTQEICSQDAAPYASLGAGIIYTYSNDMASCKTGVSAALSYTFAPVPSTCMSDGGSSTSTGGGNYVITGCTPNTADVPGSYSVSYYQTADCSGAVDYSYDLPFAPCMESMDVPGQYTGMDCMTVN